MAEEQPGPSEAAGGKSSKRFSLGTTFGEMRGPPKDLQVEIPGERQATHDQLQRQHEIERELWREHGIDALMDDGDDGRPQRPVGRPNAAQEGASGYPRRERTSEELITRLKNLKYSITPNVERLSRRELQTLVEEAERQHAAKWGRRTRGDQSPRPKVRFKDRTGPIAPPWYQKESRSKPGRFYYVNAETGETRWEAPIQGSTSMLTSQEPFPSSPSRKVRSKDDHALVVGMRPERQKVPPLYADPAPQGQADAADQLPSEDPPVEAALPSATPSHAGAAAAADDLAALASEDSANEAEGPTAASAEAGEGSAEDVDTVKQEEVARHDYRDDAFEDAPEPSPTKAKTDRPWSRAGNMSCEMGEHGVRKIFLSASSDLWESRNPAQTQWSWLPQVVQGSKFQWERGAMIGRGALGRVYKALDLSTRTVIAVKEVPIDRNCEMDRRFVEDLENEVAIMEALKHPHIVTYFGHDYVESSLFMYLEHMPGGSLTQALQQFGPFEECLMAETALQVLRGLEYMHETGVVHRDIKGGNILVGLDYIVKLADFGCSKSTQETMVHTMRGSIPWMAPEVMAHSKYGRAADIWSFGCVMIEMGTASVPWGRFNNQLAAFVKIGMSEETPPLPEGISPDCEDFIGSCVRRDPGERPTASQLIETPFVQQPTAGLLEDASN